MSLKTSLILLLIICLGAFLRFYKLSDYPVSLGHDEVSQLYDAISIAQTGNDIYGNRLPFIFRSVNDFKPPFYTYITVISYLIFGWKELTVRIPAAVIGTIIIPAVYLFTKKLLNNKSIALWASFLTAIAPFEIFYSRKSFENGAGILALLLGFYFILLYIEDKRRNKLYLGVITLSSGMYTYFSHAFLIPILLFTFLLIFKKEVWKLRFKVLIVGLITAMPLIVMVIGDPNSPSRSRDVFVIQDLVLGEKMMYSQSKNNLINFIYRYKTIADFSINRYLKHFDPGYIFANGLDLTNQGLIGTGPLYIFEFPFLILGLVYIIRRRNLLRETKLLFAFVILGLIPSGLTFNEFSPHRSIIVFTMLNLIAGVGLWRFSISKKPIILIILGIGFFLSFTRFYFIYKIAYPKEKSESINYPFVQVAKYIWENYDNFDEIIFYPKFGEFAPTIGAGTHYYLAYFGNYPPSKFQNNFRLGDKMRGETVLDKVRIRVNDWVEEKYARGTLVIASKWSVPYDEVDKKRIIHTFYFYDGFPAFYALKY